MAFARNLLLLLLFTWLAATKADAQRLTPLVTKVEWERLEQFQETITREEFQRLLDTVYAPRGAAAGVIEVGETEAVIRKTLTPSETMTLRFTKDAKSAKPVPRSWRVKSEGTK